VYATKSYEKHTHVYFEFYSVASGSFDVEEMIEATNQKEMEAATITSGHVGPGEPIGT
jgi:hypothetical protein